MRNTVLFTFIVTIFLASGAGGAQGQLGWEFGTPVQVQPPVTSEGWDRQPAVSRDRLTRIFDSDRD